jgi:type I site-specific restriction-modification system R (restriction) subunit
MPVLSERLNILVMADEAHRSQYAHFAENITVCLAERDPNRLHRHASRTR